MPVVNIVNMKNEKVGELELNPLIFAATVNSHLVHQVVTAQMAGRRAGTHAVKGRSQVRGGGRKPFRQKGTGRARQGTSRAGQYRGGGVVFGPVPRSYVQKTPKKMKRNALKGVLTGKVNEGSLIVLDNFDMSEIKTKIFIQTMEILDSINALIITDSENINLCKSSRNVKGYKLLHVDGLNCLDILKYKKLILIKSSIPKIEEALAA